jgi:hypothetical protein
MLMFNLPIFKTNHMNLMMIFVVQTNHIVNAINVGMMIIIVLLLQNHLQDIVLHKNIHEIIADPMLATVGYEVIQTVAVVP